MYPAIVNPSIQMLEIWTSVVMAPSTPAQIPNAQIAWRVRVSGRTRLRLRQMRLVIRRAVSKGMQVHSS